MAYLKIKVERLSPTVAGQNLFSRSFSRRDGIVRDPRSVADIHHTDDGLKRGAPIGSNDCRLIGRIVDHRCGQQPFELLQFRRLPSQINLSFGIDVDHDLAWFPRHWRRARRGGQHNLKPTLFVLKLARHQKEDQQQEYDVNQWR